MERRPRKNLEKNNSANLNLYIAIGVIAVAIIAMIIAYNIIGTTNTRQARITNVEKIANNENEDLNITNTVTEVSTPIGKTVNEVESSNNIEEKTAVNTSKVEENKQEKQTEEEENNEKEEEVIVEEKKDPIFNAPVEGEIIKNYSSDNLIYSETLDEWTTHLGIDYKAEKTSVVKAAADGTVKTIKNDPRYGLTVVIEHENGFTSLYSNLLSTEFIEVGESVTAGQTIATVGNTATFEILDETHLHFEILKDGNNVDPNIYIK